MFNGLGSNLSTLWKQSSAKSRSICGENLTGEKGKAAMATTGTGANCARDLGTGWKISPSVVVKAHTVFTMADIKTSGAIKHIWLTPSLRNRNCIIRFYWDGSENPSVEVPVWDFFASGLNSSYAPINSLPICVNPGSGLNCYWEMPFKKQCLVTFENRDDQDMVLYYQIDYIETEIPDDIAYFHAQFRRVNPLPYKDVYTIVDGIKGKGQYVGTYLLWGVNNNGWWGEGEIKFYMDGDKEYPTICGTGTEDYFCGSYNFDVNGHYTEFSNAYCGVPKVNRPDGLYNSQTRFSLYRWHLTDPIYFEEDLKVTIQALGWRSGGRYLPMQDDIASVAYWYQTIPFNKFPELGDRDYLEMI
ncbi:MAG: hypothetical protein K0S55_1081 [Clostridia bacterium]|nr:hypothetical protein [Clostridia bacterium]